MSIRKTEGISLRKRHYSNTSQVVTFITPEHGKVSVLAKGSKRPRSNFGGPFDVLVRYELVFIERRTGLDLLTDSALLDGFDGIRRDYRRMAAASAMMELASTASQPGEANPRLFGLLADALGGVNAGGSCEMLLLAFEARLLDNLGVFPELQRCMVCGGEISGETVALKPAAGGIVCKSCENSADEAVRVPAPAVSLLGALRSFPLGRLARLRAEPELISKLGRLLALLLSSALESEVRSFNFSQPGVAA